MFYLFGLEFSEYFCRTFKSGIVLFYIMFLYFYKGSLLIGCFIFCGDILSFFFFFTFRFFLRCCLFFFVVFLNIVNFVRSFFSIMKWKVCIFNYWSVVIVFCIEGRVVFNCYFRRIDVVAMFYYFIKDVKIREVVFDFFNFSFFSWTRSLF